MWGREGDSTFLLRVQLLGELRLLLAEVLHVFGQGSVGLLELVEEEEKAGEENKHLLSLAWQ